ncbi:MAG: pyridoxal phosphate-dependent aminotransferase family protein [Spirochaetales bacterium]
MVQKSIFRKQGRLDEVRQAKAEGWYPYFRPIEAYRGSRVIIEGREFIMAGSNNYLGLSHDPRVKAAAEEAVRVYGTSCSGSRFMNGTLDLHEELERRLARFTGKEAAICFTTGYQSNLGGISALLGRGEHVITDKYNHASIMDGIFLAKGLYGDVKVHRYPHGNLEEMEERLAAIPADEPKLVVTDGVFSMEGDIVDLPRLKRIADKYGAGVYLDEAHAIGTIGPTGRGTTEHFGSSDLADIIMCTFSKSFGSIGGFLAGDADVIEYIKHTARPLIFSASMPPANLAAVLKTLEILEMEPERVHRLQQIARKMIDGFKSMGYNIGTAETPIVPLIIGNDEKTFLLWQALYERGVYVNPVVSPAVPPNRSLLRTSYMAIHTDEELDTILNIAEDEGKKLGII